MILSVMGAIGLALGAAAETIVQPEIAAAIRDLGSDQYETRDDATRRLLGHGPKALPALRRARADAYPEVAERAADLVAVLSVRAETERLLAPTNYAVHLEAANLQEANAELTRLVGKAAIIDPRVPPSSAKLTFKKSATFWELVAAIETTFAVAFVESTQRAWLPAEPLRCIDASPNAFRVSAIGLPERDTAGIHPVLFTLHADPDRTAIRVESIQLDEVLDPNGVALTRKAAIVAPPIVDPAMSRMVRGGRMVIGANGVEIVPDSAPQTLTLNQQQIAVPILWPAECERIETLSGELRATVRGAPMEILRLEGLDAAAKSETGRAIELKLGKAKPDEHADPGFHFTAIYATKDFSFAENPSLVTPDNETIVINGRARIILRGQAGLILGDQRAGGPFRGAAHGLKILAADGTVIPFRVEALTAAYQLGGIFEEQFSVRIAASDIQRFGPPKTATLTAKTARTISIPFRIKYLSKPSAAKP